MNTNIKKTQTTPQMNQSAEKTMRILELLSSSSQPMRLLDIARSLDLNTSTASRFLSTLSSLGYVAQEREFSRYYLTYKLCSIANRIKSNLTVNAYAAPYLHDLARHLGETVCLAIEERQQVVYIDVVNGSGQMVQSMQRIGSIAPMHCTGIGKLLLLNYSYPELLKFSEENEFTRFTVNTVTTVEELMELLDTARQNGYALDNEECELGARCIALPIYDYTNRIIAGFSVTGSASHITDAFIQLHLPLLLQTAGEISRGLGYLSS